jgi:hypothetical protein
MDRHRDSPGILNMQLPPSNLAYCIALDLGNLFFHSRCTMTQLSS